MNKIILSLAIATMLFFGTLFTGCGSSETKVEEARGQLLEAEQDLKNTEEAQEWETFRTEAEVKIRSNESTIAETRKKMKETGKVMDAVFAKKIDVLEERNNNLVAKIDAYEKDHSDWESFKREFSHDMDELGQSIKDLAVDNKK